jgi:hypothetical protein
MPQSGCRAEQTLRKSMDQQCFSTPIETIGSNMYPEAAVASRPVDVHRAAKRTRDTGTRFIGYCSWKSRYTTGAKYVETRSLSYAHLMCMTSSSGPGGGMASSCCWPVHAPGFHASICLRLKAGGG